MFIKFWNRGGHGGIFGQVGIVGDGGQFGISGHVGIIGGGGR